MKLDNLKVNQSYLCIYNFIKIKIKVDLKEREKLLLIKSTDRNCKLFLICRLLLKLKIYTKPEEQNDDDDKPLTLYKSFWD